MIFTLLLIFAYLLGSINFAIVFSKIYGFTDPRKIGSHNPGATNILRTVGKKMAVVVLILDLLKGLIPVLVAKMVLEDDFQIALIGLAAFMGHLYPIFFHFQGGKGVATYLGVLYGINYPVALLFCLLWVLVAITTRYSSLGAITAATVSPIYLFWFGDYGCLLPVLVMLVFLLIKHRDNIKRLQNGSESKLRF